MTNPTINKKTFKKIFKNDTTSLAMLAASLTQEKLEKYQNNITCNKNNPTNVNYIIDMPKDNLITITNTKTNQIIKIKF